VSKKVKGKGDPLVTTTRQKSLPLNDKVRKMWKWILKPLKTVVMILTDDEHARAHGNIDLVLLFPHTGIIEKAKKEARSLLKSSSID
jgi:hypothetical protein